MENNRTKTANKSRSKSKNTWLPKGYSPSIDHNTGELYYIDNETGEVFETETVICPKGTMYWTPQMRELYKKKQEEEQKKYLSRFVCNDKLGKFYWHRVYGDFRLSDMKSLKPETVARLVYLYTYLKHGTNVFMRSERSPMRKNDLPKVLRVSRPTANSFWKEVSPEYISENEEGFVVNNSKLFFRGDVSGEMKGDSLMKLRIEGIRRLYETVETKSRKGIGYVFWLLPYINIRYNVLCYNPLEEDIEKIERMSIAEFCKLICYDHSHIADLMKLYSSMKFEVDGHMEYFCVIPYRGKTTDTAGICINPNVVYSGSDYERVAVLSALCRCKK